MPEEPDLRNNSYVQVQDVINNALNTLLNEPGSLTLQPKTSNFTSNSSLIEGRMEYNFQDGDVIQPVSFLNMLHLRTTTTLFPETTFFFSVTPSKLISGSAVVTSKLVFNTSSPVPSESLVLSAIKTLRNSRESQLNESVKVVNVTYEKISETSYAVVFTFNVINITMPEEPKSRDNTNQKVQDTINNALNTLLNEPGSPTLQPKSSNFTSTSNQIDGRMEYTFQDGDVIQPVSFLNELRLPTTTTVFPETTTSVSVTTSNLISGSAVVTSKLVFNSSSPVPSESLVLNAIKTLRNSRESKLNESVKVVNVTYEKISETSYAVVFTLNVINISMPEDPVSRGNTNQKVQDTINNALNTLLNEPGSPTLQPKSSNFTSTSNQIDGRMEYTFQDGDVIQPVSFLNELRLSTTTTVFPETTTSVSVTAPNLISGSAVVTSKLVFNSSSPVPSESLVLNAIKTLRNSRESQLNESVKVVNVTYEKISETSYAVVFTFNVINISMPEDPVSRSNTNQKVQDTINNALSTLLNEPGSPNLQPKSSNFTSTSNQIDGRMEYTFQDGDVIQPVSFLNELRLPTTTTVFPETTTSVSVTTSNLISGSAVVTSKLVFNSSSPVPSESLVLSAIKTLRNSRESQLNESVKVVNVTYEKISETSYAVVFTFNVINISMPEDPVSRGNTNQKVQDTINNALNTLLNEPGNPTLQPKSSNFTSTSNQIDGRMEYSFQDGDVIQPVSFLNELRLPTTTTVFPEATTSVSVTTPKLISGSAVVTSKLVFNASSTVPSESLVLNAIKTLRNSRESQLNESVKVVNVTYEKISETSYAVVFTFNVINISMPEDPVSRGNTNQKVQDTINNALNTLLNEPGSPTLQPNSSNFTSTSNQIDGRMEYSFQDGDVIQPVSFLNELRLPTTTTVFPETTTSVSFTAPNLISGSAVVTSKLVFNSSSPVPSESLVLNAIKTLRNSRESQLNESVKVVNVTYEKISETSYAVVFTFNVINISMPQDPVSRGNTNQKVQDTINNALNTLLNEPGSPTLQPKSSNFTSTSNQIDGRMEYTFQDGDVIQPVSFLNELRLPTTTTVFPETTFGFSLTPSNLISGSAVVTSKLVFNSSSPVPSESLVLNSIKTLRNSRESQLNESVKVVNVTYEKISETSYAVVFTFNVINISMPEDPVSRGNTNQKVQDTINNALNTLLNEPGSPTLQPKSSNFISISNQIDGRMEYSFQDGDVIQPVSFLNELRLPTTTTVFPETTTSVSVTTPNLISGSAVVTSKLVFNSSSPVPSESLVLNAIKTLRNSRESQLNELVKVVNVTYEKISETSYAVVFTFDVINISMPEDPVSRGNTNQKVQDTINNAVNFKNEQCNTS
ncbi:mucin-5AC-like [Cyprinus carpio]|uniref:Mucin-5AC-like n=1 Tax=Cyprinus carpio TaxID=7962 RepID=A0A9Q9Y721_CYPCA|nr:mucin-5AC-like [Cyprinus carpio]